MYIGTLEFRKLQCVVSCLASSRQMFVKWTVKQEMKIDIHLIICEERGGLLGWRGLGSYMQGFYGSVMKTALLQLSTLCCAWPSGEPTQIVWGWAQQIRGAGKEESWKCVCLLRAEPWVEALPCVVSLRLHHGPGVRAATLSVLGGSRQGRGRHGPMLHQPSPPGTWWGAFADR